MTANLEVGQRVLLTTGEYSDYGVMGLFEVLKSFDAEAERAQFVEEADRYYQDEDKFLRRLIERGYLAELNCAELLVGAYGMMDASHFEYTTHLGQQGECSYCHTPLKQWDLRQAHRDPGNGKPYIRILCKLCAIPEAEPLS